MLYVIFSITFPSQMIFFLKNRHILHYNVQYNIRKYSDTSANEDNSFRNNIR